MVTGEKAIITGDESRWGHGIPAGTVVELTESVQFERGDQTALVGENRLGFYVRGHDSNGQRRVGNVCHKDLRPLISEEDIAETLAELTVFMQETAHPPAAPTGLAVVDLGHPAVQAARESDDPVTQALVTYLDTHKVRQNVPDMKGPT